MNYFRRELPELAKNTLTKGKFLIIHSESVKGAFDTFEAALKEALSHYPQSEFVIQQAVSDEETVNFLFQALSDSDVIIRGN
ncbi:MAG TPA: hypothetical protein PKG52_08885 [bacterium]|nr:hypothetical protein [bacterium]